MPRVRTLAPIVVGAVMMAAAVFMTLQPAARGRGHHDGPPSWWKPPADVRAMLKDVSASRFEGYDRALAGFGTRHTLSSQDDPNRGIGAARDWIFDQFQSYAAASDGRMTVAKQSFVQPPGPRNPNPVTVTNLVATLRGTQPESADRVYVVSGHYDSRCTDVLNFTCDA